MTNEMVTVESFPTPAAAHVARTRLEAAGIPAFLADEETVSTAWHLGRAVGGIKLQVPSSEAERASTVLAQHRSDDDPADALVESEPATARRALLAAVLGLPFPPLQLYSLYLIGSLLGRWSTLPSTARRHVAWAGAIDLWVVLVVAWFIDPFGG